MSSRFSPDRDERPAEIFAAIIECDTFHAALTPFFFDLFRNEARRCGFEDVNAINVNLKLEMMGLHTTEHELGNLTARIDDLWLGANVYAADRKPK